MYNWCEKRVNSKAFLRCERMTYRWTQGSPRPLDSLIRRWKARDEGSPTKWQLSSHFKRAKREESYRCLDLPPGGECARLRFSGTLAPAPRGLSPGPTTLLSEQGVALAGANLDSSCVARSTRVCSVRVGNPTRSPWIIIPIMTTEKGECATQSNGRAECTHRA